MKHFFHKIAFILLLAAFFSGCKGKSEEIDESKPFSIVGLHFTIDTGEGKNQFPFYKDATLDVYIEDDVRYLNKIEPIEYLDDGMKCQILGYNDEYRSAYVNGKKTAGWVPLSHYGLKFDKKILLAAIKPALDGNEDAVRMLEFQFTELTLEESMKKLQFIIDYVGLERLKDLNHWRTEDELILTAIARLIEFTYSPIKFDDRFGETVTNPIHLLAEFANEDTWNFLDSSHAYRFSYNNSLSGFYRNAFFDSDGVSAQMRAIKAGNLDTLKYFYEHDIPNYYFAQIAEVDLDDKEKIFPLIMSTKDSNEKSLADYVAECNDEKIRNFMSVYDLKSNLTVEESLEYLRGIKKTVQLETESPFAYRSEWLYQADFENNKATVITETKLLNPNGKEITVKPLEQVEIISKLEGDYGEELWDYGNQVFNDGRTYYYRYNYYLVRTEDFKMGIIGASSLVHRMGVYYDGPDIPVGGCESLYDFYYRLLYNPEKTENQKTSWFAEIYKVNYESQEVHYLETGYSEGPVFESEPVYLGEVGDDFRYDLELVAYRDFEMERESFYEDQKNEVEPFYTFIFKTSLDYPEVSYNCLTVNLNKRLAYKGFYKMAYAMAGKSEDDYYKNSYCYFESEKRKIPECIFGKYEMYSKDMEYKCLGHHVEHLKLDSLSLAVLSESEEDLDYLPEW